MKTLFSKKRKTSKIIALWLAFIMIMVPISTSSLPDKSVKAEGASLEFTRNISMGSTIIEEEKTGDTVTGYYSQYLANDWITFYTHDKDVVLKLGTVADPYETKINWKGSEISITSANYDVGYVASSSLQDVLPHKAAVTAFVDGKTSAVPKNSYIGIYTRYNVNPGGVITAEDVALMQYTLVDLIYIGEIEDKLPSIRWVNNAQQDVDAEFCKEGIKISGVLAQSYRVLTADNTLTDYTICYNYADAERNSDGTYGEISIGNVDANKWQNAPDSVYLAQPNNNKTYKRVGYVSFKYNDGSDHYVTSMYKATAPVVQTGDNAGPNLNSMTITFQKKVGATWSNISLSKPSGKNCLDISNGEEYRIVTSDLSGADANLGIKPSTAILSFGGTNVALTYNSATGKFTSDALPLDSNFKNVDFKLSDLAGNQSTKAFAGLQIKGVDKTLKFNKIAITTDKQGNNVVDLTDATNPRIYTKDRYYLTVNAQSGYKIEEVSATYKDKNGNTQNLYKFEYPEQLGVNEDTGLSTFITGTYDYYIELPRVSVLGYGAKGNFDYKSITVSIKDANNSVITENLGEMFFDNVEPTIENKKLQSKSTGSWENVTGGIDTEGAYQVKVTSSINYRFAFDAKDTNGSGIASVTAYTDGGYSNLYANQPVLVSGNMYSIDIDKTSLPNDGLTLRVKVVDKAGNVSYSTLEPTIKKSDEELYLGKIYIKDQNGKETPWSTAWNIKTNKKNTLYVEVSSGEKISSNPVLAQTNGGAKYITGTIVSGTNKQDEITKRYNAVVKFEMPKIANANEVYGSMTITINDAGGNTVSKTLGELIYDNSLPEVKVEGLQKKWVKDYQMDFTITPGSQSVETTLESASYVIGNGKIVDLDAKGQTSVSGIIDMPESKSVKGTKVTFDAIDEAGNSIQKNNVFVAYIDKTSPVVGNPVIAGGKNTNVPFKGAPSIKAVITDNISLATIKMDVTYPDGSIDTKLISYANDEAIQNDIEKSISYSLFKDKKGNAEDGSYSVKVTAVDKAGNVGYSKTVKFDVDNTAPELDMFITKGKEGGKAPKKDGTDYYYRSDVTVELVCYDENVSKDQIVVTDNGKAVDVKWSGNSASIYADLVLTSEGKHKIEFNAKDSTGNKAKPKTTQFVIDKTAPTVTTTVNGLVRGSEQLDLASAATVGVSVSDMTYDPKDVSMQVRVKKPDQPESDSKFMKISNNAFTFGEEGDYSVSFLAKDMANNPSDVKTVNFRVDTVAPALSIGGISGGGSAANSVAVTFNVVESFWWDSAATVSIYRKAGDGASESLMKTVDMHLTGANSAVSETLTETGIYRFEFNAHDRVGHTSTLSQTFTIDREPPVIVLEGVKNYDKTIKVVDFLAQISDDFYASKKITIEGTRTDIDGKVNPINFGNVNQAGNPTIVAQKFSEDGIYDISVKAVDAAGNSKEDGVHFIVDKTAPVIGDLSKYDGKVLKEFTWENELDSLVSDLTVCDIHMYLNGSEYDGTSAVEDGAYSLVIQATDELGNSSEKAMQFTLDTKAPVFIVTGVEDGEVKKDVYNINISLQLDEDTLQSVKLNGDEITLNNNTCSLEIDKKGSYKLIMSAIDEAGNEASHEISFRYGSSAMSWWIWLIIGAGVAAVVVGVILVLVKNKKED